MVVLCLECCYVQIDFEKHALLLQRLRQPDNPCSQKKLRQA